MADRRLQLCVIEGDGIGHEVIPAALDVLAATRLAFDVRRAEAVRGAVGSSPTACRFRPSCAGTPARL